MKSFQKLPPQFQCAEVKEYYDILCKKQGSFVLKRTLDIFASVILLVFLIIPIAIIAILVKTDSKGPVFTDRKGLQPTERSSGFLNFVQW